MSSAERLADALRCKLRQLEGLGRPTDEPPLSSGVVGLDRLLPGGGFVRGSLVEWLADGPGGGAGQLSLLAGKAISQDGGLVVVFDRAGEFYPPGLSWLGLELPPERLLVVRPREAAEELWAWDQVLGCAGVALVWGSYERVGGRDFRRLQLAAERGGTIGFLLRSERALGSASWAAARLLVRARAGAAGRCWRVELASARGGFAGGSVDLALDEGKGLREVENAHEANPVSLVSPLAAAAGGRLSESG